MPDAERAAGKTTYRSLTLDGQAFEVSDGFTDLHARVYEDIRLGGGFNLQDARPSITLVRQIRSAGIIRSGPDLTHPFVFRTPERARGAALKPFAFERRGQCRPAGAAAWDPPRGARDPPS